MAFEIKTAKLPRAHAVAVRAQIPMRELSTFIGDAFHELEDTIRAQGAQGIGPPFVRYYAFRPDAVDLEAVLCCDVPLEAQGRVTPLELEAAEAAVVRHLGPYEQIGPVYDAIQDWLRAHGKHPTEAPREVYLTSPDEVPDPTHWVTLVEQPMA